MKIYRSLDYRSDTAAVVALGCFDGVHRGHASVIRTANAIAEKAGLPCLVWSFSESPKNFFSPGSVPLITDENKKNDLIQALGADIFLSIPFDGTVASLSADDFLDVILRDRLSAKHIVCGFNFSFGAGGKGNVALLREFCEANGIGLTVMDPVLEHDLPISSSLIREAIVCGRMEEAVSLLGRPYSLTAEVVDGQKLARNLGFPTFNQLLPPEIAIPRHGVYVSRIRGLSDDLLYGITNVGMRPTVKGDLLCAETHIFDFCGDLYGKRLTVELLTFLREEVPFPSLEALTEQVGRDIAEAKRYLEAL